MFRRAGIAALLCLLWIRRSCVSVRRGCAVSTSLCSSQPR